MYDAQLGRFHTQDRFAEKYLDYSPYQYALNNPILYIDVNGDSANFSQAMNKTLMIEGKEVSGKSLAKKTVKEWSKHSGLKLKLNKDGKVINKGEKKGNQYSQTAREMVKDMVEGNDMVNFDFSTTEKTSGKDDKVVMNPNEISMFVEGTSSDLNPLTMSYGLTGLHEYMHTDAGGNTRHTDASVRTPNIMVDRTVGKINTIRNELSTATGTNYGARSSYSPTKINGIYYFPWSSSTANKLEAIRLFHPSNRFPLSNVSLPTESLITF